MGKVREIASDLERFNIFDELKIILNDLQNTIAGLNKEQLSIGEDAQGNQLKPYADPFYAIFKKDELGSDAPLGIPDLKLTGDFYKGFTIIIQDKSFDITSTDVKTLQLEGKYGDIFGLNDEKLSELAFKYILPKLVIRIKEIFQI